MQITAAYIASCLAAQAESFVREILPNGKRDGTDWVVGSLGGEEGKSLKVQLSGDHAGHWRDWATNDRGDLLDLCAQVNGADISTAIDLACAYLNIQRTTLDSAQRRSYKKPEPEPERQTVDKSKPIDKFFAARGISRATLTAFRVLARGDDTIMFPFMRGDDLVHIQYRGVHDKRFWSSKDTELILFGWQVVDPMARECIIAEGPMDAMAWYEYGYEAFSVPNGAGRNDKWIESELQHMERFDKIYVCMDKDDPGKEATARIVERLGRHRCFVVHLPDPHKDVNACLVAKVPQDIIDAAIDNAKTLDPGELRNASYFTEAVVEHFNPNRKRDAGFLPPWPLLTNDINFGYGQTTIIAGWNGCGKTTIVGQITLDAARQGVRACVASLEFKAHTYIAWLVRQATCNPNPSPEEIRATVAQISENLWAFSAYGKAKLEKILEVWDYAHSRYGTKLFVLDNFSKLSLTGGKEDKNGAQAEAASAITEFAVNHDAHVIVLAHSRKGGKTSHHEEVNKIDIRGAGELSDLVDIVLLLHRNKKKEIAMIDRSVFASLPIEEQTKIHHQPDGWLTCEKNRHGESEPKLSLWFDRASHQYTETGQGKPVRYAK